MSEKGNQPHPSSIHPSSKQPGCNQKMMSNMTAPPPNPKPDKNRILEMHAIFLGHDTRGDNKISIRHLGDCLRVMGANPTEAMVNKHVQKYRASTMDRISFDEVLTIYGSLGKHGGRSSPKRKLIEEEQLTYSLSIFDRENSGFLPAIRIWRLLTQCGERMSAFEVDELLKGRINEQGMVNYKELIHDIVNG
ncbi:myosin-2 essential light chain [Drosophila subpulchrella]|uniref:myosin-2 essential light chain n=1 Tax=Drosophila subpulchrella TaxID=1486046 RepID=UPI0018A12D84|nr:myosin-2 essential light chain [Drosophila subpulchrella]